MHHILLWFRDEQGATSAEYALLAGFIAAVIVAAVAALGLSVNGLFTTAEHAFSGS